MPRTYPRRPLMDRVLDRLEDVDGHWIWTGRTSDGGYGLIDDGGHDGVTLSVHRVVWEHFRGPIPDGLELDHLDSCLRTRCCNPECLDPVTHAENQRRRAERTFRCRNGHPYTPENTRITPQGHRNCRQCGADRERARRARNRRPDYASRCDAGHRRTEQNTVHQGAGLRCLDCTSDGALDRWRRHRDDPRDSGSANPASLTEA